MPQFFFNIDKITEIRQIKTINKNWVYCVLLLKDGRLATCSSNKITIYTISKHINPVLEIIIHNDNIYSIIQQENEYLISCSMDCSIKIIKLINNKYLLLQSFKETFPINKIIKLKNNSIVSCSAGEIRFYNYYYNNNNKYQLDTIMNFQHPQKEIISIIQCKKFYIATFFRKNCIKLIDSNTFLEIKNKNNLFDKNQPFNICLISKDVVAIYKKGIILIKIPDFKIIQIIDTDLKMYVTSINKIYNETFLIGYMNGKVKQMFFDKKKYLSFFNNKMKKMCFQVVNQIIQINNETLVSCGSDSNVTFWKINK